MRRSRRDFLKLSCAGSAVWSFAQTVPGLLCRTVLAAAAQKPDNDRVLVILQLSGGNDGLNMVVPYADDLYAKNRFTLRLRAADVLRIDSLVGFHPRMAGFSRMLKEGTLSVIQGVGYPNPSGQHPVSMRIWQTARLDETAAQTGWLGRAVDALAEPDEVGCPAVFVGQTGQPFTLHSGRMTVPSLRSADDYRLHLPPGPFGQNHRQRLIATATASRPDHDNPLLAMAQRGMLAAHDDSRKIEAVLHAGSGAAHGYPPFPLAQSLRSVAQLIRADLGIRIFHGELGGETFGGFDNHANQRDNHAALLDELSQSVAAFVDDLQRDKLLDRVLLLTFSEFGRTLAENGRRGTDHGSAAPMFVAGGTVRGGLIGPHPKLNELENAGPKHHTDFRRVYATALDRWLGVDSRTVLGGTFPPVDFLGS